MNHEVFISHSSRDREAADDLLLRLEARGVACWIAYRDVPAGADYSDLIPGAIRASRVVVAVLSRSALRGRHVKKEMRLAGDDDKPVVPLRLEEVELPDTFEYHIGEYQWEDAFGDGAEGAIGRVLDAVVALLAGTDTAGSVSPPRTDAPAPAPTAIDEDEEVGTSADEPHETPAPTDGARPGRRRLAALAVFLALVAAVVVLEPWSGQPGGGRSEPGPSAAPPPVWRPADDPTPLVHDEQFLVDVAGVEHSVLFRRSDRECRVGGLDVKRVDYAWDDRAATLTLGVEDDGASVLGLPRHRESRGLVRCLDGDPEKGFAWRLDDDGPVLVFHRQR